MEIRNTLEKQETLIETQSNTVKHLKDENERLKE